MNSTIPNRTTVTAIATVLATSMLVLALAPASPALAGSDGHREQGVCRLAPQYLPRTPDAVEGWLRHC